MCVIIHSPDKNHRPSLDTLRECERANPHGSGIAWVDSGRVYYLKGLSADAIAAALPSLSGPVVIHFRWATVGGKRTELCHPFPVTEHARARTYGSAKSVLFHNGHWSDYAHWLEHYDIDLAGPVSDSRAIAVGTYLAGRDWLRSVPTGRFALFSVEHGVELMGDWIAHKGCDYSNLNWVRRPDPQKPIFIAPKRDRRTESDCGDAMACFGD